MTPEQILVQFLTDRDARFDLLAEDVTYQLPDSLGPGLGGTHTGKATVVAMLQTILEGFYDESTMAPEVHVLFGNDQFATMFFTMNAVTSWGENYSGNRYSMTVRCEGGKIAAVHEVSDTKRTFETVDMAKFEAALSS